jgi:hypothetical protein
MRRKTYQAITEQLVEWNRAYREGEPLVNDHRYDMYEDSLRREYPDHPLFAMVGHDEERIPSILEYIGSREVLEGKAKRDAIQKIAEEHGIDLVNHTSPVTTTKTPPPKKQPR